MRSQHFSRPVQQPSSAQPNHCVGEDVGDFVGWKVGVAVGKRVGDRVGERVGLEVGDTEGAKVGLFVGERVGLKVGDTVGFRVGEVVGEAVGAATQVDERHVEDSQSLSSKQDEPIPQGAQAGPPQSMSDSAPLILPSVHVAAVGEEVGLVVGERVG